MLRTHLSRALLAALAVAALASGSTLVTSSVAEASFKIDPGFSRGRARIDPGFNRDIGPKYTVKQTGGYVLHSNCVWIDRQGHHGPDGPRPAHPGPNGKGKICY